MKKILSLLLVLCLSCITVSVFAEAALAPAVYTAEDFIGSWTALRITYNGTELDSQATGLVCTLTVSENGTAQLNAGSSKSADSSQVAGPWEVAEGGMNFTDSANVTLFCPLVDGLLTVDLGDGLAIVFAKDVPETAGE